MKKDTQGIPEANQIDMLDAILNSEDKKPVHILPDGRVVDVKKIEEILTTPAPSQGMQAVPNQELFDLIQVITGKVLVQSELNDIIRVVEKSALQQKPAVLEGKRKEALSDVKYFEKFMETVPPDGYVMQDFLKQSSLETIKSALQSPARNHLSDISVGESVPAVETVTWQKFSDIAAEWSTKHYQEFKTLASYYEHRFPKGLRITDGTGE